EEIIATLQGISHQLSGVIGITGRSGLIMNYYRIVVLNNLFCFNKIVQSSSLCHPNSFASDLADYSDEHKVDRLMISFENETIEFEIKDIANLASRHSNIKQQLLKQMERIRSKILLLDYRSLKLMF